MGLSPFHKSSFSSFESKYENLYHHDKKIQPQNPNPKKFEILEYLNVRGHTLLKLKYHGCKNYEGTKILVFKNVTVQELLTKNSNEIDPHFCDNSNYYSPVARIEPTSKGWDDAYKFCQYIL